MITITKRFEFCYAHHLPHYEGKCSRIHGHNSVLEVTVEGSKVGGYPGMVMDFGELKKIVAPILEDVDHQYLNVKQIDLDPPTAENLVKWFAREIIITLPETIRLVQLKLSETPNSWVTWRMEK